MDKLKEFCVTGYGRYAKTKAFIRKRALLWNYLNLTDVTVGWNKTNTISLIIVKFYRNAPTPVLSSIHTVPPQFVAQQALDSFILGILLWTLLFIRPE